jgi:hypothetical protein
MDKIGLAQPEIFFWKNEPKLCPSLLTIIKKRTQNEPKLKPNEPKKGAHLLPQSQIEPKPGSVADRRAVFFYLGLDGVSPHQPQSAQMVQLSRRVAAT